MTAPAGPARESVAAAIANARGNRRGVPDIVNILDILPKKLRDEVLDDADAVLAALGISDGSMVLVPRGDGWQPIETAPKDGTWVMLFYRPSCVPLVTFWAEYSAARSDWAHRKELGNNVPTHWRPLPWPPATATEKSHG